MSSLPFYNALASYGQKPAPAARRPVLGRPTNPFQRNVGRSVLGQDPRQTPDDLGGLAIQRPQQQAPDPLAPVQVGNDPVSQQRRAMLLQQGYQLAPNGMLYPPGVPLPPQASYGVNAYSSLYGI